MPKATGDNVWRTILSTTRVSRVGKKGALSRWTLSCGHQVLKRACQNVPGKTQCCWCRSLRDGNPRMIPHLGTRTMTCETWNRDTGMPDRVTVQMTKAQLERAVRTTKTPAWHT